MSEPNPIEMAEQWHNCEHTRKVLDKLHIPEDVTSDEFADWLCCQYTLATALGIRVERDRAKEVYVATCYDRHFDPRVKAFRDRQAAIDWVNKTMKGLVAHPEFLNEADPGSFEYCLSYELEENYATVKKVEIH